MKSFLKKILKYLIVGPIILLVATILIGYFTNGVWTFSLSVIRQGYPMIITVLCLGGLLVMDLLKALDSKPKKSSKAMDSAKDDRGKSTSQYYSRDFVTDEDLKKEKGFNFNTLKSLRSCSKDGILVRAEEKSGTMNINFVKPIHTLVVGTTSSGKTTRFVEPTIQIMSMTAAKPSFVITDPKGELFDYNSNKLKKEGYEVHTLDLRDPYASVQWNPLVYPYDLYHEAFNLDKQVRVHQPGDDPRRYNLVLETAFDHNSSIWYEFKGTAYYNKARLEQDMRIVHGDLKDKAYNALNDVATTIAPIESTKDPSWERTAQRLIHAVMLAMLEDSRIPELGLTKEKYNFYNVYKICNLTDSGRDTYKTLKTYLFDHRDKFSKVGDLASTALNNAETTSKNYMGFVSSKTALFNDSAISFMTSRTEIDFIDIDEKPTAIFLKFPDEIAVRHPLLVLFITQLYKRLVEKANTIGGTLKRNVYFLLDEFGNMPKFPEFGSIMAVGRSRGIFFELCVQSYSQLYQKYGQDEGKIIKDNCPIQVYIASEDTVTNKEFSELLGKKTISITTENRSKGPDGKETVSTSEQIQSRPIAYPEELMTFRAKSEVIIKTFEPNACLKTKFTPSFEGKCYDRTRVFGTYVPRRPFDEDAVFYDVKERNKKLSVADDDDDDDLF